MPATEALRVEGLRDLQRAFALADKESQRKLRQSLKDVGEPVRSTSEQLALTRIRRIGPRWSRMRVGVTRSLVYVAPVERGKRSRANTRLRRPNLADLLMGRAMQPALDINAGRIEGDFEDVLEDVANLWGSA